MKPFDRLSGYLGAIERRLRWLALSRGAAVTAVAALVLTVLAVLLANNFAFSPGSVTGARVFLFLGLAFAIAAALIVPVIRLNRRRAACEAESKYPEFQERLLTFTERSEKNASDPFLHLLAADTMRVADQAEPGRVAKTSSIFSFSSTAVVSALALIWLATSGPGFLGYGSGLLWGGVPKGSTKPFYAISVTPGNKTVRKRSDQMINAQLMGFTAPRVQFFAKYAAASKWEGAEMRTEAGGSSYEFMIAGVPETLEYYIEAGGVRSKTYKLNVVDLPGVKRVAVKYHYPAWLGLPDVTEDPGGDLRAVAGTTAELTITTDRPLTNGVLMLDDGSKIKLDSAGGNLLTAKVPVQKDGMYHVSALESGDDVRLSEDYFIEAMKDNPPEVKITRPGRDYRASPIEEVTISVDAKDDFGLKDVQLHYTVNGGAEKIVPLLATKNAKSSVGTTTIALEDFKVQPGDIVSLYATASDARNISKTDMFFIEAQPFERNYTQSQQSGGGGGGGGGDDQDPSSQISQRQKEIITATWNQAKGQGARGTDAENSAFLAGVQSKLKEQAASLAQRMKSRELDAAGDAFKSFVADMEQAVTAMTPAVDKLKGAKWQDAIAPEQKALQFLLRAEATRRDIQIAFGQQQGGGGGGGGNGATRDLEGLFDLELDTEKNQYEGAQSNQSADSQQRAVDDAMQKLKDLARRQQELAEQQKKNPQMTSQQRWEQEMLRREAEQLKKDLEQLNKDQQQGQLTRNGQQQSQQQQQGGQQQGKQQQGQQQGGQQQGGQQQAGQQQAGQQQGGQQQQGQQQGGQQQGGQQQAGQLPQRAPQAGQQQGQQGPQPKNANSATLQRTLDGLQQALQDMRQANSQQGGAQSEADARRAAERLKEASDQLGGMQTQQSANKLDDIARQAGELARKQQQFEGDLRRALSQNQGTMTRQQATDLANQHEAQVGDVKKLDQQMQSAVRDMMSTQRQTSTQLRQTLGEMEQAEIARDMQRNADWIRRGLGEYAAMSEAQVTSELNQLSDSLDKIKQKMAQGGGGKDNKNQDDAAQLALGNVEKLRQQMQAMAQQEQNGQKGQGGQQQGKQQQGQQQGGQQQGGQQQGGQQGGQQQGGQQQGGQQGGQQQGGQQQGGQQGGQQQGGQQQGGQQQGGQQQGGQQQGGMGGGGNQYGGNTYGGGNYGGAINYQQGIQQTYRDALSSLQQLQQQYKNDPNAQRDINNLIRDFRQFDPAALNNDPLLSQRIQAALANVEQVELELRKKVADTATGDGSIRSPGSEQIPPGYSGPVAEYWRRLSTSTPIKKK